MGGGGTTDAAIYNSTTGLFHYQNLISDGNNVCINGDCSLPGETPIVDNGCFASVSVFTIDYDAPLGPAQHGIRTPLLPLVAYENPGAKMMLKVAPATKTIMRVL